LGSPGRSAGSGGIVRTAIPKRAQAGVFLGNFAEENFFALAGIVLGYQGPEHRSERAAKDGIACETARNGIFGEDPVGGSPNIAGRNGDSK